MAAAVELLKRRYARRKFRDFVYYTFKNYKENWHHRVMTDVLELVIQHKVKRVLFKMPPRHGKSEHVSRRLPAAYLARNPYGQVIHATYNSTLARREGRSVQRIMKSPAYRALYPNIQLPDAGVVTGGERWVAKADNFEIPGYGGSYQAAGMGGMFTGTGMTLGIIDDPIKNSEEADSETLREAHWDWYLSTFISRDEGDAAIVVCMTDWHEDSLAGRIVANAMESGEDWLVISFEALRDDMANGQDLPAKWRDPRKPGQALWPGKFDREWLLKRKKTYGIGKARWWNALYQQRPGASEGNLFHRDYWEYYEEPEDSYRQIVHVWDTAHGKKKTNDYSVFAKFGVWVRKDGVACGDLLDLWREKVEFPELGRTAKKFMNRDNPSKCLIEAKASGQDLIPVLVETYGEKRIEPRPAATDKTKRAEEEVDQVEDRRIRLPRSAPWLKAFLDEHANFPNGKNDDQVDVVVHFLKWLRENFKVPHEVVLKNRYAARRRQLED